jgi:hypothetical protein
MVVCNQGSSREALRRFDRDRPRDYSVSEFSLGLYSRIIDLSLNLATLSCTRTHGSISMWLPGYYHKTESPLKYNFSRIFVQSFLIR